MFLKECQNIAKENKMTKYITDDLQISSDDSDEEDWKRLVECRNSYSQMWKNKVRLMFLARLYFFSINIWNWFLDKYQKFLEISFFERL